MPRRDVRQAQPEALLEAERRVEAGQVARQAVRRGRAPSGPRRTRPASRSAPDGVAPPGARRGSGRSTSASISSPSRPPSADRSPAVRRRGRAATAAQGAVDEDPDRALGATEDAGDLGGRHLVDEAQDERPAPVAGQARRRLARPRRPRRGRSPGPSMSGRSATCAAASSGASGRRRRVRRRVRRRRCGRSGTARPGTWRRPRRRPGARAPRSGARFVRAARNVRSVASSASWWSRSS